MEGRIAKLPRAKHRKYGGLCLLRVENNVKGSTLWEQEKAKGVPSLKGGNNMTSRVSKSCSDKLSGKRRLLDDTSI